MTVLAVDLAAKFSAAILMDDDFTVLDQFDSWQKSEEAFIYLCAGQWFAPVTRPDAMVVEDLPHGLAYSRLVKTVLRLQGRIVQALHEMPEGNVDDIVFLAPQQWRSFYQLKNGTGPNIVVPTAAEFGYEPPDLTERAAAEKGGKARARKVATDYCAAYLIARWAVSTKKNIGTYDQVGTSRYTTTVIRKKDVNDEDS